MSRAPSLYLTGTARIGEAQIFTSANLQAPAGQWTCLLGSSGVGKSTLLRILAGLDEDITLDGKAGAGDGLPLAGRVALMAQSDLLMPWLDVMGNVTLGAKLRGEAVDAKQARAVLQRVGLDEHLHKRPRELSGGQRQRVALARTLMEDRPVVLLDEPFSALDARTRATMQDLAAELLQDRTVLHVTHDAAEAARLGQSIVLMTEAGIEKITPPAAPVPRAFDADETLAFQASLLRRLMVTQ
jgi:putative hydroxymethylpyrimidine transport system ATP-binding protein